MRISIIVAVYKIGEAYLRKCLHSVTKYVSDEVEVIIVDDGSPDNCGIICDEFSSIKNVHVIHQENQGVSVARNTGIENSTGEFIIFVDGDDYINEQLISNLLKVSGEYDLIYFKYGHNKIPLSCGSGTLKDCSISSYDLLKSIFLQIEPMESISIASPWGKVYRRQFLQKNKISFNKSLRKCQDREFNLYYLESNPKIGVLDYFGYIYITNSDSVCNKYNEKIINYYENLRFAYNDFINKFFADNEEINNCYCISQYIFLYEICLVLFFHKDNPNKKERIKKFISFYTDNYSNLNIDKRLRKDLRINIKCFIFLLKMNFYKLLPLFFNLISFYKKIR